MLLREVDRKLDLIRRSEQTIPDPRQLISISHPQSELRTSRTFGIAAGYKDGNDHHSLRHDPTFQVAAGRTPAKNEYSSDEHAPLASPATHCRFENRVDSDAIFKMHEVLLDTFVDS